MSASMRKFLYFILAVLLMVDFYLIFNAGSPNSVLRLLIMDNSYDISITVALSILIAVISFSMIRDNDQNSIKSILEKNSGHILELKKQNRSNEEIAESFLKELGSEKGLFHFLVKIRILRYLAKIK